MLTGERQISLVRTLGEVGAARSAEALSTMIGKQVGIRVMKAESLDPLNLPEFLGSPDQEQVVGYVAVTGDINGVILVVYSPECRDYLTRQWSAMMGMDSVDEETEASCISEVTNIISASYSGGMSQHSGTVCLPTPPVINRDMMGAIVDGIAAEYAISTDRIVALDAEFQAMDDPGSLKAAILLLLDQDSMSRLCEAVDGQ